MRWRIVLHVSTTERHEVEADRVCLPKAGEDLYRWGMNFAEKLQEVIVEEILNDQELAECATDLGARWLAERVLTRCQLDPATRLSPSIEDTCTYPGTGWMPSTSAAHRPHSRAATCISMHHADT